MAFLLHQILSETAAAYPDNKAVIFNNGSMTYSELETASDRLADFLVRSGVRRLDRVGIYIPRSINSIIGICAILKAGAMYVPIDPFCPESRITYILDKCGITYLISSREMLARITKVFSGETPLKKVLMIDGYHQKAAGKRPDVSVAETDPAYILFTSGSTGNPKGVMLSHRNALTFIDMACDFFTMTSADVFCNISPLQSDMSVFDIYVAFKAGAALAIVPENIAMFPSKVAEFVQNNRITVWNSVPSMLALLANLSNLAAFDLSSLRLVLFAGEVFQAKYLRRLMEHIPAAKFYNIYGQTEANSSTYYLVDRAPDEDGSLIPIGKPFPGFEVFALDESGKKISGCGSKGELFVRSPTVALGYWREPEKTGEKFVRNPLDPASDEIVYRTGDMVRLDEQGDYVFCGRVDHMIKSRGYRIELGEIETVLASHPLVETAVVVPIPDDLIGNRIAAVIVPCKGSCLKKEDIVRNCARQLPKYMLPDILIFNDSLPTTSSGKPDRRKLSESLRENEALSGQK